MVLTIAPTLACNFGCDYCFQGVDKPAGRMPTDVQDGVVELVKRFAPEINRLHVAWYGGEPLLAHAIIETLSDRLIELSDQKSISYDAMIVTNGYKLTSEVAQSLYSRRIKTAQVTLDGAPEYHDRRRSLLGGQGTFERIIGNLRRVVDNSSLRIVVRINIDSRNSTDILGLLKYLNELGFGGRKNFAVYFAPVEAITEGCHAVAQVCMAKKDYAQIESQLQRQAYELGLASVPYPQRFRGICGAIRPRGFVVVPSGDIHKCWDTVSMPHMKVGGVFDVEGIMSGEGHRSWMQWTPFDNETCRSCKILPNCAGSCAHKFVNPDQPLGEAASLPCPSWKYQIKERLLMLAEKSGVITREDYEAHEIATDPWEICPVPAPTLVSVQARLGGRLQLPILEQV
jgi:uncharacterized protein